MEKVIVLRNGEQSTDGALIWVMLPELADTFADKLDRQQEQICRQVGGARWIFNILFTESVTW